MSAPLKRITSFFTSLRLTVACLFFALVLVFVGTLAQVHLGLYQAQHDFFRSFFLFWGPNGADWKIPVFPGGYLLGAVLLINLFAAHAKRFKLTRKKAGIFMVHAGLVLLLFGQLLTDLLSVESAMHLRVGQTKNYSEIERLSELAVIDTTEPGSDKLVAIPDSFLAQQKQIQHQEIPFTIEVKKFYANSFVTNRPPDAAGPPPATQGIGPRKIVEEIPRVTSMDFRDVPSAVLEVKTAQGSLGTWLVSGYLDEQTFDYNNRTYALALRLQRRYKPFYIQLLDFRHDIYKGTDIPKNFSSRIHLHRPDTGEDREVLIYMNNPLRYWGETYYQASFDRDDGGTIFQVVRNPSWLTPYFSCALVALGLITQFLSHLVPFVKRRTA
jgi:hypothetical protein